VKKFFWTFEALLALPDPPESPNILANQRTFWHHPKKIYEKKI
jgi:hypothetical protein